MEQWEEMTREKLPEDIRIARRRESILKAKHKYYHTHKDEPQFKEKIRISNKKWSENNRDKANEYTRKYYLNNRESILQRRKEQRKQKDKMLLESKDIKE